MENNVAPEWVKQEDFDKWIAQNPQIDLIEIDSLDKPGEKREVMVKPPDDIAWALSMKCLSNITAGANDPVKAQIVLAERCVLDMEPALKKEMEQPSNKVRLQIAIGTEIGNIYPMPEARLKKTFRKQ